jgi:hypothetical protein
MRMEYINGQLARNASGKRVDDCRFCCSHYYELLIMCKSDP